MFRERARARWILLNIFFQIATKAKKRDDRSTLLALGKINNEVASVAQDMHLDINTRDVALAFLSIMDEKSAFQVAMQILRKDNEKNYAALSKTIETIVKGEAERERLRTRSILYDLAAKLKNSPRKRALELILLTRASGL